MNLCGSTGFIKDHFFLQGHWYWHGLEVKTLLSTLKILEGFHISVSVSGVEVLYPGWLGWLVGWLVMVGRFVMAGIPYRCGVLFSKTIFHRDIGTGMVLEVKNYSLNSKN